MSEFFGGIFDSLRSVGDDISGFFDSSLGQAVAKGGRALFEDDRESSMKPNFRENFVEVGSSNFSPTRDLGYERSNNFSNTEIEWYKRLQRFAGIVQGTEVKK